MRKKRFLFGILLMLSALGFVSVAYAETDPRLNGTWVCEYDDKITFSNGIFRRYFDGILYIAGRFNTYDTQITMWITHVYGMVFADFFGMTDRFLTRFQVLRYMRIYLERMGLSEEELLEALILVDQDLDQMFSPFSTAFSVSGNMLTFENFMEEGPLTFIRK